MFLGELRVPTARESLASVRLFLTGVGQRLRLREVFVSDLTHAVEKSLIGMIDHMPDQPSDLIIRADADEHTLTLLLTERSTEGDETCLVLARNLHGARGTGQLSQQTTEARGLEAIQTVSEVMATSTDLDTLLRLIIDKLIEAIDAERGTLYLIDEARGELYSKVLLEDERTLREIRVRIGSGIAGHVAATGEIVNNADVYQDSRFNASFDRASGFQTTTMLTAPMRNPKQKIIGVVQLLNKRDGPFTERDERLLVSMAAQAAISIENARLYAQEIEQQLILQELRTAKAIQESILPSRLPTYPGWQISAFWQPAQNVAGDFYDVQTLEDESCAFLIADVSGKGIPAALFMSLGVTVLRIAINLDLEPSELMRYANKALASFNPHSRMFASIFVGYLNMHTGVMSCVSAGHNPPLLYRAATRTTEYVKIPGVIAGMFDGLDYSVRILTLEPDDVLVLYTDGITEAMNARDEEFGTERLSALVAANASRSSAELTGLLSEAVRAFSGERGAFDDETLLIIKRA